MIKLLILSGALLALSQALSLDQDVPYRLLTDYKPIANDYVVLQRAINATEVELVNRVFKVYKNITLSPKIKVNSAEEKKTQDKIFPPILKYRANITLLVWEDPFCPGCDPYVPIVTFNISIVVLNYGGETTTKYTKLRIIGLPGVLELLPNNGRPWGAIKNLAVNDTGAFGAIEAVEDYVWEKITKASGIQRKAASNAHKDFVINSVQFLAPKYENYSTLDYEYRTDIALSSQYQNFRFLLSILARFEDGQISFNPQRFIVYPIPIKPVLYLQKPESSDLLLKSSEPEAVDEKDYADLLEKLRKIIIGTVNYLNILDGNDENVIPLDSVVTRGVVSQKTVDSGFKIFPPIYFRTYIATNVAIFSPSSPDLRFLASNLTLELSESLRNQTKNGPLRIYDEKLVRVNDFVLPEKPSPRVDVLKAAPKPQDEIVDEVGFNKLLQKLRLAVIGAVNYLNRLEGKELVVPNDAQILQGFASVISQKTKQRPELIFPPIFKLNFTVTNVILVRIEPFAIISYVTNLTLEMSELRRNQTLDGPLTIYGETLVRVNDYVLPDSRDKPSPRVEVYDLI